jgi:hypothetical protein
MLPQTPIAQSASYQASASADRALLDKIKVAVAAVNEAETTVTTAQAELVSRSKVVGELLLEAKKRHPKVADFEAFLKRVNGLGRSRAYDLLRLAGGRTTDEELRKDARERVRKHRAKKMLPTPEPVSVTDPDVTESSKRITQSPEVSAEERRAQNAALDVEPEPIPRPDFDRSAEAKRKQRSRIALNEFTYACKNYLPRITEEVDRQEALRIVTEMLVDKKAKAA